MRVFVAIELPEDAKRALGDLIDRLRASGATATWVNAETMHLTLRFLGEIDDAQLALYRTRLAEAYLETRAFSLTVEGVSAFPNLRRPSVFWAGVTTDGPELAYVQEAAERAAQAIGLEPEPKAFHPHVTLARVKEREQGARLAARVPAEEAFAAGEFAVAAVTLFQSRLTPQGPVHTPIQEYRFA